MYDEKAQRGEYEKQINGEQVVVEREHLIWQLFEDAGVHWTVENDKGESLLHIIAADKAYQNTPKQRVKRFKFLLGKGLDPLQEDKKYRSPLDVAAALEQKDLLALFAKSGEL